MKTLRSGVPTKINVQIVDKTSNKVNVIFPRRTEYGVWVFTDLQVGLVNEPFVGKVNTMLDMLTNGKEECIAYISAEPLPKADCVLVKAKSPDKKFTNEGWYKLEGTEIVGWLCSATLKYFADYPVRIYVSIEKK